MAVVISMDFKSIPEQPNPAYIESLVIILMVR